jgi:fatty aldehyde decarbonylase
MTQVVSEPADQQDVDRSEGPRDQGYWDLISYIVSNAVAGEIMAIENYSDMVDLMPDVPSKIEAIEQAAEETEHIQILAKLGKSLGFSVQKRIVEPPWKEIRRQFRRAVERGDLAACLIMQDLMTETMAIMLYTTLAREADTDQRTARIAEHILHDELEHLQIGITRIRRLLEEDHDGVHESLIWAHHRVMPELFGMISTSCDSLCDELNVDCGSLRISSLRTDLDTLRARALDQYIGTLDAAGFDVDVTNRLIAGLASYADQRGDVQSSSGKCC